VHCGCVFSNLGAWYATASFVCCNAWEPLLPVNIISQPKGHLGRPPNANFVCLFTYAVCDVYVGKMVGPGSLTMFPFSQVQGRTVGKP